MLVQDSLVPRPLQFLPSVCVHINTRERKTGKAWEHSSRSECELDVGEEGPIFKYVRTKLESEITLQSRVQSYGRVLERIT